MFLITGESTDGESTDGESTDGESTDGKFNYWSNSVVLES